MWGVFKKQTQANFRELNKLYSDLEIRISTLEIDLLAFKNKADELVETHNKIIEGLKFFNKKLDILAKHFQLEYKKGTYISKRK